MTQTEVINGLWKRDWTLQALGVCLVSFAWMLLPQFGAHVTPLVKLFGVLYGVLTPAVFDSIGFFLTQDRDADISTNRGRYRVIQNVAQWGAIYPLVGVTVGWWCALGCALSWWLCTDDVLFYILRKESFYGGEYTWTSWSFFALVLRMKIYTTQFVLQAILGLALAVGSIFL